jgi:hypothetical protein
MASSFNLTSIVMESEIYEAYLCSKAITEDINTTGEASVFKIFLECKGFG